MLAEWYAGRIVIMIPGLYCTFEGGGDQHQINNIIIFIDCVLNNDCPYLVCVYMCSA